MSDTLTTPAHILDSTSQALHAHIQELNALEYLRLNTQDIEGLKNINRRLQKINTAVNENIKVRRRVVESMKQRSLNFQDLISSNLGSENVRPPRSKDAVYSGRRLSKFSSSR